MINFTNNYLNDNDIHISFLLTLNAIAFSENDVGVAGEKEKHGTYWYKLLTSRSSRVHKTAYERLHVLEFDSNRKVTTFY